MLNEYEIEDMTHLATLKLLKMAGQITTIHSDLLIRHFDDAAKGLLTLINQAKVTRRMIPEEEGE